ncbi:hypothetical protein CVT24_013143 [Panaeolus cyanescens]|uniref:Rhamnogalacturonase A/B/Epimerase-like pectate lyase domain-containing protein n=1 Tax=Panaeolus cyanescens TaxID=181874 RepID=A0A409VVU9_9AGAR|nr:hypothetical protein CVT24_013143 [Panaeolus cyanescens]
MRSFIATSIVALAAFFNVANAGGLDVNLGVGLHGGGHHPHHPHHPPPSPAVCPPGKTLGPGTAAPGEPFWMEKIKHQGKSPFNPNPQDYKVFRNVKDFGAVGDGVHDDTAAINAAISAQGVCGRNGCRSSTVSPVVVYFPQGTYLVSTSIYPIYYVQLIGDARNPPTILAAPNFQGLAVIDPNPYGDGGAQPFTPQTNFHRSIRNFIIDLRQVPSNSAAGTGIHWQMAQATSLINIVFEMSKAPNTAHQGIWMESGSGGFMGDLVFNGGKHGIWSGNQQFTVRNVTINDAKTAIFSIWNWGWTYQDLKINNCEIGLDIAHTEGAFAIVDATINNTPIFARTPRASNGTLSSGSLMLNNIRLKNVPVAVGVAETGAVLLQGTTLPNLPKVIDTWAQGNVYKNRNGQFVQSNIPSMNRPHSLLDSSGKFVSRGHPQYENYDVSQFVSVRDHGAVGDGVTDDTAALQNILNKFSSCKIIFVDAGFYVVTDTLKVPAGTRLVGEAWSVIAGKGPKFQKMNKPEVVVKVGEKGKRGITEITDIVFTTSGPAPGAIIVEWNAEDPVGVKGGSGMWDTHIRTAGAAGTNLESNICPKLSDSPIAACQAAFLSLHITKHATGYFEGTWVWLADHDLDIHGEAQLSAYSGRGILSESHGPVWMVGTASEHHVMYQYNLVGAKDHYMGLIQTESPYFQPNPPAPAPFVVNKAYNDPDPFPGVASSWALNVDRSKDIVVYGAGLYSFFDKYSQDCIGTRSCQAQTINIDQASDIEIYSLSTVSTVSMLSLNAEGVVHDADNLNGFASTMTAWRRRK